MLPAVARVPTVGSPIECAVEALRQPLSSNDKATARIVATATSTRVPHNRLPLVLFILPRSVSCGWQTHPTESLQLDGRTGLCCFRNFSLRCRHTTVSRNG